MRCRRVGDIIKMIRLEDEARSINCCRRVKKRFGRMRKKAIRSLEKSFVRKRGKSGLLEVKSLLKVGHSLRARTRRKLGGNIFRSFC